MENIKSLKSELKSWSKREVRDRFKSVDSTLDLNKITELKVKINQLRTT